MEGYNLPHWLLLSDEAELHADEHKRNNAIVGVEEEDEVDGVDTQ